MPHAPTISDLKRTRDFDGYLYTCTLPDARILGVVKVEVNRVDARRSMVYAATAWAVLVKDEESGIQADQQGFETRKAAFEAGIRWAAENPKGTVVVDG